MYQGPQGTQWDQHFSEELHSLGWSKGVGNSGNSWNKGGYKGSFNDFQGVGKSDLNKGVLKGDGKETAARVVASMGIATGVGSHSQSRCRQMDEFMENQRRNGKGNSKGGHDQITHNVEENKNQFGELGENLGAIAACAPWNTVAVAVLLRTGALHCNNSMRMRRCRLVLAPLRV